MKLLTILVNSVFGVIVTLAIAFIVFIIGAVCSYDPNAPHAPEGKWNVDTFPPSSDSIYPEP